MGFTVQAGQRRITPCVDMTACESLAAVKHGYTYCLQSHHRGTALAYACSTHVNEQTDKCMMCGSSWTPEHDLSCMTPGKSKAGELVAIKVRLQMTLQVGKTLPGKDQVQWP